MTPHFIQLGPNLFERLGRREFRFGSLPGRVICRQPDGEHTWPDYGLTQRAFSLLQSILQLGYLPLQFLSGLLDQLRFGGVHIGQACLHFGLLPASFGQRRLGFLVQLLH